MDPAGPKPQAPKHTLNTGSREQRGYCLKSGQPTAMPGAESCGTLAGTIRDMDSSPIQRRSRRFGPVAAVAAAVAVVGVAVDLSAPQRDAFAHSSTAADFFDREVTWAQGSTIQHGEQRGRKVWIENGRPVPKPAPSGERGFLSPDGRFVLAEPVARLTVTRAADGRRVHVDLDRFAWFGGWQDEDRFYALTRTRYEDGFDPAKPDRTTGTLVSCELPTGECTPIRDLTATRSVVMPGAENLDVVF